MEHEMKVLVCGSREFKDERLLGSVLDQIEIDTIISGMARGADRLGAEYARTHDKLLVAYPALWDTYGRGAGPIRNAQMLTEGQPDLVVAFWDRESKGTKHMIDIATKAGIEVRIIEI